MAKDWKALGIGLPSDKVGLRRELSRVSNRAKEQLGSFQAANAGKAAADNNEDRIEDVIALAHSCDILP